MNAKEARELAKKNQDPNAWDYPGLDQGDEHPIEAYPLERVFDETWDTIEQNIMARADSGRCTLVLEPFVNIPGKVRPEPIEDEVCGMLVKKLEDLDYVPQLPEEGWWDRVDGRVVFRIRW